MFPSSRSNRGDPLLSFRNNDHSYPWDVDLNVAHVLLTGANVLCDRTMEKYRPVPLQNPASVPVPDTHFLNHNAVGKLQPRHPVDAKTLRVSCSACEFYMQWGAGILLPWIVDFRRGSHVLPCEH